MEAIVIKDFGEGKSYKILSLENIKGNEKLLEVYCILVKSHSILQEGDKKVKFLCNDYDNPITISHSQGLSKCSKCLVINSEWYVDNRDKANEIIRYVCSNTKSSELFINNGFLIDDKLIESICQNQSLEKVTLAEDEAYLSKEVRDKGYVLSLNHFNMLKESKINRVDTFGVCDELKENFDPLIGYNLEKTLIGKYNYSDLHDSRYELRINYILNDEEISNFKYLVPGKDIFLDNDNYFDLIKIINKLKELNYSNRVEVKVKDKDKEKFNSFILNNRLDYDNLHVLILDNKFIFSKFVSFRDYFRFVKQLDDLISPAKNLSNFEKYIFAYNVVKKHRENNEDLMKDRELYLILEEEYMNMFKDVPCDDMYGVLLERLGIASEKINLSLSTDTPYDEEDFKIVHARRYVYLKDDKYNIDGYYVSDPTMNNDLEYDSYTHLALTNAEESCEGVYVWAYLGNVHDLLNVRSIMEFNEKTNFLLVHNKFVPNIHVVINELIYYISLLDKEYLENLRRKYFFIYNSNWPDDVSDLLLELAKYIVSHVNKELSGKIIMQGVANVYSSVYGYTEDMLDNKIQEIFENNKRRRSTAFSMMKVSNNDGEISVDMNPKNNMYRKRIL